MMESRLSERNIRLITAVEDVIAHVWQDVGARKCQWAAIKDVGPDCQQDSMDVLAVAYPVRQKSAFTPISMVHRSWMPEAEPGPPPLERWLGGYVSFLVWHPSSFCRRFREKNGRVIQFFSQFAEWRCKFLPQARTCIHSHSRKRRRHHDHAFS